MRRIFTLILFVFALKSGFAGQNPYDLPKTNFNVFTEVLGKGLGLLEDDITILGRDKIFKLDAGTDSEMKNFFLNVFRQKLGSYRFVYEQRTDSCDYRINIKDLSMGVSYTRPEGKSLLGEELTRRVISVSFEYSFYKNETKVAGKKFSENYKDSINVKDYEYVQNQDFPFMNSELPEKSFLGRVFVPALVVLTSAAAVVLFFTIRSK